MTTTNTVITTEIPLDPANQTRTAWGTELAAQYYFVIANGTAAAESFDAADLSSGIRALMAQYTRGVSVWMGAGDDTVTGSSYADTITAGDGVNRIDGGVNEGSQPGGAAPRDVLNVFVADKAAAAAVGVSALEAGATGADAEAYAAGYRFKVRSGAETDYVKNVEQVNVFVTGGAWARTIQLAVNVIDNTATQDPASVMHLAWVQGTDFNDSFSASGDLSSATRTRMDELGRGVWVSMGAGDDSVTGSGFGDDITLGAGTNYADGGANAGSPPWGGKAQDVLHVVVADQAAANSVQVIQLGAGMSGLDAAAFAKGYTHKISAGAETDYVKGIERVSIELANTDGGSTWVRDVPLAIVVQEANLADADIKSYYHLAWVSGTAAGDVIDASGDTALLSAALKDAMGQNGRGIWIDGGLGNDTITGSAYADNFRNGAGNSRIDGGANTGGSDVFEIAVASSAEMNAVKVEASDDPAYTWMVSYGAGTQKDYLKNIEAIAVSVTGTETGKWIPLAVQVQEIKGGNLDASMHYAWVQGTGNADSVDVATAISAATRELMTGHGRGIYVETGTGDDSVAGSGFGDDITLGSGTNYADGGANAGSPPWGGKAQDVLHVVVADQAAANSVQVIQLGTGMSGLDADAFAKGYTHKISAGGETDYVKGIERVSVEIGGANGSTWARDIPLAVVVQEANLADPDIKDYYHLAWVNGTANGDLIDAGALLSAPLKAAMAQHGRGIFIDGGEGSDTITGSAYADNFRNGAGSSRIDGGANTGGLDVFEIAVASTAEMNGVKVEASDNPDYSWMVTYGSGTQKDYLKNVEAVTVNVAGTSTGKWIPLAVQVQEIKATDNLDSAMHYAWVQGTSGADTVDATSAVSAATRDLMSQHGRGVYIDTGAGDDSVTGSGFGDDITLGSGTNYADGGANAGSPPWGGKAQDVLHVVVADQAAANSVQVTQLGAGMGGADAAAFAKGYTHKISAGAETDYVKGIERVSIEMANANGGSTWVRDLPLAVLVQEANLADANINNYPYLGWVTGTAAGEAIDLGGDASLLSAPLKAAMTQKGRGIWVDAGLGDDTITGSGFGDNIVAGGGVNYIDGGAHDGTQPGGAQALDRLEVYVASQAAADAVGVTALTATMQGDDGAAYAAGYRYKIVNGTVETDYVKNVEQVSVIVWTDRDGDSVRDGGELAPARTIALGLGAANTAPTFAGAPAGVAVHEGTQRDFGILGATVLANGKMLALDYLGDTETGGYSLVLARANADGSVDTTWGGVGAVPVPGDLRGGIAPLVLANGKIVLGLWTNIPGEIKLMQLNADGSVDTGFGTGGSFTMTVGAGPRFSTASKLLADAGGKLLLVGSAYNGTDSDMFVLRLNANGSLDTGFNGTGKLVLAPSSGNDTASGATLLANGKLLLVGSTIGADGSADLALLRLNQDGSYDTNFGTGGKAVLPIGPGQDGGSAMQVLAGGKILVAGNTRTGAASTSDYDQALVRLNADGSTDTSFGNGGKVVSHLSGKDEYVAGLEVQADGKIVVLATADYKSGMEGVFAVTRYNADGSLDTAFGNGGTTRVAVHGNGEQPASLALAGGKILVFGSTVNDTSYNTSNVIFRLDTDGSLDTSFAPNRASSLGGSVRSDGVHPVTLDAGAAIYDAELAARGSYGGASLVLARRGGASADDVFAASGEVSFAGGKLTVGGTVIGTVAQAGGTLTLTFSESASQGLVNRALHGITYLDNAATLPQQITIDWTFSDGNDGSQGAGGAKTASGATTVRMGTTVVEVERSATDASMSTTGQKLSTISYMANAAGTARGDTFDATGFSNAARGLMDEFKRGAVFNMGDGNDKVTGTGYSDVFLMGTGVNRVDGGANAGTLPNSTDRGRDILNVYVASDAQAKAVSATVLTAAATGEDAAAFAAGYTVKIVNGLETDYLKNVESVNIFKWNDANGNGTRDAGEASTFVREIPIAIRVFETTVDALDSTRASDGHLLKDIWHLANANGAELDDRFDAATELSSTVQNLMKQQGRGVWVDAGAGNDTLTGSAYGDNFVGGAGVNRIDGGANGGLDPDGHPGRDTLEVFVTSKAAADAVAVTMLTAATSGADGEAYAQGYRFKVVNGSGETDYLKNVEQVNIQLWNDKDGDGQRDYSSDPAINEVSFARGVDLASITPPPPPNTAPTFIGAPGGVAIADAGRDYGTLGGAVLASGKLLAFRYLYSEGAYSNAVLARYNPDGSIDTSYGGGTGTVTVSAIKNFAATSPVELSDGKVMMLVSETVTGGRMQVLRLNADGSPDAGFGSNGSVFIDVNQHDNRPARLLVQADGKIVVAGTNYASSTDRDFALVRLNADGSPDNGFASGGKLVVSLSAGYDRVSSAVLQANGKILVAGSGPGSAGTDIDMVRVNADGSLDTTFGIGGKLILPVGPGTDTASDLVVLDNGKILLAGSTRVGAGDTADIEALLVRLNVDGSLDTSFGSGGMVKPHLSAGQDFFNRIKVQADGKIVALGVAGMNGTDSLGGDLVVTRFLADGSLDTAFGSGGTVRIPTHGMGADGASLALVGDKIVLFGSSYNDTQYNTSSVLVRLNGDGSLDTAFNPNPVSSLDGKAVATGLDPQVLDANAAIYDAELVAAGSYGGASLTLARHGGANADDHFSASGDISFADGKITVGKTTEDPGVVIGAVTEGGGTLTLNFGSAATQGLVNRALHGIAYTNASAAPPAQVTIDWTFNDGAANGARTATGYTVVEFGLYKMEVVRSSLDPANGIDGLPLAQVGFMGEIGGTANADSFDARTGFSNDVQKLMDEFQRGAWFHMGPGNDTVTGTGYSDQFVMGSGLNRVDGGANAGTLPFEGGAGRDILFTYVGSEAQAKDVSVTVLGAGASGADAEALATGYAVKVVNGSETDYLKNVEAVRIFKWIDTNGNGLQDGADDIGMVREVDLRSPPPVQVNTAPTFGMPAGVGVIDAGYDLTPYGGAVLGNGKTVVLALMNQVEAGSNNVLVLLSRNPDGTPDTGFGGGSGMVLLPTVFGGVAKPAVQADGKIVIAVSSSLSTSADFKIVRFNADGSPDTSFGNKGETVVALGPLQDAPTDVLVQGDGKIVVIGNVYKDAVDRDLGIVRLNGDGSLDTGFNGSGKLVLGLSPGRDAPASAAFDAQGGLLVAGYSQNPEGYDTYLVRVKPGGTQDTAFAGGRVFVPTGQYDDFANGMTVLANGKILVSGDFYVSKGNTVDTDSSLVRLNADGSLDTSFGTDGKITVRSTDAGDRIVQVLEQADGKILVTGWVNGRSNNGGEMGVARFNADGSIDTSFGDGGATRIPLLGVDARPLMLSIVNGKIVVMGATSYNTSFDASVVLARLNVDGSFDTSFNPTPAGSLNGTVKADGLHPVVLDFNATVYDAELAAAGNYGGSGLILQRRGGASADDHFWSAGEVSFQGGQIVIGKTATVAGTVIGTVSQADGKLELHFNAQATQELVTRALHGIAYTNSAANPPASVAIDWFFGDGNNGSQGSGGVKTAAGSTTVQIGLSTHEVVRAYTNPAQSTDGRALANIDYLATVDGTARADSASAVSIGAGTRALMDEFKRGAVFDMAGGGDTVEGSAYGDLFVLGRGVNYVDGGANAGVMPWGTKSIDQLQVFAASAADAAAVKLFVLDANATGDDAKAFGQGYGFKLVNGAETDYFRNVEKVVVLSWTDTNGNGIHDAAEPARFVRDFTAGFRIDEISLGSTPGTDGGGNSLAKDFHFAWAYGAGDADSFDAAADLSQATRNLMNEYQRGVYVELGAGNDTVVGSGFGDNINAGAGVNYVDGGANAGHPPLDASKAIDVLEVVVRSREDGAKVAAIALADGMPDADGAAFKDGYRWKIVGGAETDYVKNVENVVVKLWTDADGDGVYQNNGAETEWLREIVLEARIDEVRVDPDKPTQDMDGNPLATSWHFAWGRGTSGADTIDGMSGVSDDTRKLMVQYGHGMWAETQGGGDTVYGTAYGDFAILGQGVNYFDGRGNLGTRPDNGNNAYDTLQVNVASKAVGDAVKVVTIGLDATGEDGAALAQGYRYKVTGVPGETDYLRNVEEVNVAIWNEAKGEYAYDHSMAMPLLVTELPSTVDPTKVGLFAAVTGNMWDDRVGPDDLSAAVKALMSQYGRGARFTTGYGNDHVEGTAQSDEFHMGSGTNWVDGGGHGGTSPYGDGKQPGFDVLILTVKGGDTTPVSVTNLTPASTGLDAEAFAQGYEAKAVYGDEIDYIRNVETVAVHKWVDANGNGLQDGEDEFIGDMVFRPFVDEIAVGSDPDRAADGKLLSATWHFGWVNGNPGDIGETVDAWARISDTGKERMSMYTRGLWMDLGGGDDVVKGTPFLDNITGGTGTNWIDGSDNTGAGPDGSAAVDTLEVYVGSLAERDAVSYAPLNAQSTGMDALAFVRGYQFKIVTRSADEIDYVKNVERLSVMVWADADHDGQRDYDTEISGNVSVNLDGSVQGVTLVGSQVPPAAH